MKRRKSSNYLVISSAHIGMSEDILAVYARVAKHYKASVIHLGPLATDEEIRKADKLKKNISNYKSMLYSASTERQEVALEEKIESAKQDLEETNGAQSKRVSTLNGYFGHVTYVVTDSMILPGKIDGKVVKGGLELSRNLFLSPVPPRGMKTTAGGISDSSKAYLTELGKSWFVAHPIPEVQCYPKPGLNEAHNYTAVGSLKHASIPEHTRSQYEFAHMPCAIMVLVDKENGEFHPTQLHIDYLGSKSGKKTDPVVIVDGLVFTPDEQKEVLSSDRATFGTDYHAPFQHPGVVAAHRAINTMFRPGTLIDGGDMGSFESVSHWLDGRPGDSEGLRLKDDLTALRALMDAVSNVDSIKKKVLIDSNHHEWLTDFVTKNPTLKGLLDWSTLAKDMFSDWEVIIRGPGDNKVFWFGDLMIRHGDKDGGVRGRFKHIKYLCGHFHKYVVYRRSIGLGCGAALGPSYIGNEINAWQSQLATITKCNDVAAVGPKIVLHDKERDVSRFAYRGSIYEVDAYHIKR